MFNTNGYDVTCMQIMYMQLLLVTCMQIMYMQLLLMLLKLLSKAVTYCPGRAG